jgi:hypothetical protein
MAFYWNKNMETIQHQPKAITPCIRPKMAQSKEIETLVDEFLKRGGKITKDVKPTVFVSQFGRKPSIAPVDTAVWTQKTEVLALMKKHKILTFKIAGKLKIPTSQLDSYLKGLRYPSLETQERIAAVLDSLIITKGDV